MKHGATTTTTGGRYLQMDWICTLVEAVEQGHGIAPKHRLLSKWRGE